MKIFVANLPYYITGAGIQQLFSLFGPVSSSRIITEKGKSKGFGFLEMENEQQAQTAIKQLDGSAIDDRNIVVRQADKQDESERIHKRARIGFQKAS